MSSNVKLLLDIAFEGVRHPNLSSFTPLKCIICCKLYWTVLSSPSLQQHNKKWPSIESALLLYIGGKLSWVEGSKEWSRVAGGSACVTARAACSGSRLGSVRMAVVVLSSRSELRTTEENRWVVGEWRQKTQWWATYHSENVQHGFNSVLVSLTWSESSQGAVLIQPWHSRSTQVCCTGRGHHAIIGLEQRLDDDTELALGWGNTFR